jgi:hypothetical protein
LASAIDDAVDFFLRVHEQAFPQCDPDRMTTAQIDAYCERACRVIDSHLFALERKREYRA